MPAGLRHRLRQVLVPMAAGTGVALLLVIAIAPLTGPLGGAAVAALLVLGMIVGLLALSARDGCSVLTLLVVLLLLLPQHYVIVGPLKSVGSPAVLVALAALGIWAASRILNLTDAVELHPVRWALLAFTIAAMASYAAGMMRDLTTAEQASMDRVVFQHLALLGVALLAVDALGSRDRITTLLQRLVLVGGLAACVGILEFAFSGFDFREVMLLPGLTTNVDLVSGTRSGFDRIAAGASHPIEFSVVTAALAPSGVALLPARGHRSMALPPGVDRSAGRHPDERLPLRDPDLGRRARGLRGCSLPSGTLQRARAGSHRGGCLSSDGPGTARHGAQPVP